MPTREEIREGIAKHFRPHTLGDIEDDLSGVISCTGTMELWRYQADELIEYLHDNDVVIKVDRELPVITTKEGGAKSFYAGYQRGRDEAVEPLIKEEL